MGGPGLTGRRINNTQRSLSSQWNKPNTQVCVWAQNKVSVCPGHGYKQQWDRRAACSSEEVITERACRRKQRVLAGSPQQEETSCWRSDPWLWPDHSEVMAGLRPAGSCADCVIARAVLHLPGKGPPRCTCARPPACCLPRACHQSTEPCHLQLMCQQGADRARQAGTSMGECAGVGAGLRPTSANDSHAGVSFLRKSLCVSICKGAWLVVPCQPSPAYHPTWSTHTTETAAVDTPGSQ